ncbi:FixH family protein [Nitratifractor sp.]
MAEQASKKTYWPHMILGFLAIGITLGFWTVKHAIQLPVHESNEFMMKYQQADMDYNQIQEAQARFDARYKVALEGMRDSDFKPKHVKRHIGRIVALQKVNTVTYRVTDKAGNPVDDANVTLLLTRPFTEKEDQHFTLTHTGNGIYRVEKVSIPHYGRYILRVRVQKGDAVGFMDTEGYRRPPVDSPH